MKLEGNCHVQYRVRTPCERLRTLYAYLTQKKLPLCYAIISQQTIVWHELRIRKKGNQEWNQIESHKSYTAHRQIDRPFLFTHPYAAQGFADKIIWKYVQHFTYPINWGFESCSSETGKLSQIDILQELVKPKKCTGSSGNHPAHEWVALSAEPLYHGQSKLARENGATAKQTLWAHWWCLATKLSWSYNFQWWLVYNCYITIITYNSIYISNLFSMCTVSICS